MRAEAAVNPTQPESPASEAELDVMRELVNIGVGRAVGMLNQMVSSHITMTVPQVSVLHPEDLARIGSTAWSRKVAGIRLPFQGALGGTAVLAFPPESAARLVSVIIGAEDAPLDSDSLRVATLQEIGNIVLNGVMGSIGNVLNQHITYIPPDYFEGGLSTLVDLESAPLVILYVRTRFEIESLEVGGDIIVVFQLESFDTLLASLRALMDGAGRDAS